MSELSPLEIAKRAKSAELSTPVDRFYNAQQALKSRTHKITIDEVSERYPRRNWVVTEALPAWDTGINDIPHDSTVRLGYPKKDRKSPNEIHIIINDEFSAPWASVDESNVWQQLIDSPYTDVVMSDENQRRADAVVDVFNRRILEAKLKNRRRLHRIVGSVATVGVLAAGVYGGLKYYNNKQEEDAARVRAEQQRVAAFDALWEDKDVSGAPIPADSFGEVAKKQLPTDIPTIGTVKISDGSSRLKFTQPLDDGLVRQIQLEKDGCYEIEKDIEEDTTISAVTNETDSNIVVALLDDANIIKICKNGLFTVDKPATIVIQIHK